MKYNVKYWDKTGPGLPFNEDVELRREYTNEEKDSLEQELKRGIVKKLRNKIQESDIEIITWVPI